MMRSRASRHSRSASRSGKGFTLIEMLISLSIFAVITAFVTANFRAGKQGDELRIGSNLVATIIRRAQTAAVAGQTVNFCRGGTQNLKTCLGGQDAECPGVGGDCVNEVPAGWGVRFSTESPDAKTMILYADIDGDKAYDDGEATRTESISGGPFVAVTGFASPVTTLDIVFVPPKPSVYFNGSAASAIASVELSHTATGQLKTVTVNRISGQISAD